MTPRLFVVCAIAGVLLVLASPSIAQTLYRWTDDKGQVHLSDKPPANAKDVKVVPMPRDDVPASDRAAAQTRAAADRARLQQIDTQRAAVAAQAAASAAGGDADKGGAAGTAAKQPGESDCAFRQRAYQASAACWGGFRLANGGFKEGALEKCGPPQSPPACQ
ncbi:DUF4124 domain-containing protein [Ramlibacter sp.]|uniref:DUF4124 domain-containing protein n=1 Tax=Ramlibacter sp. TaxID=1917967 RepID=UPI0035B3C44A